MGFTPFFMVYGVEAVLQTDLDYGAPRVQAYDESMSEKSCQDVLDQLNEVRDVALIRSAKYHHTL